MNSSFVEASLAPLKSFQQRTVRHAFHRLFLAPDSTGRFLVADEVGLGKTLVARGVIALAIDHLRQKGVERIDIVYVCSNASIARANLSKLVVGDENRRSFALATRLTLLATKLASRPEATGIAESPLNFVSLTPGTSFDLGSSAGRREEREVLFHLLDPLLKQRTALMNLLQGRITRTDDFRGSLTHGDIPIDESIRNRFNAAFHERADLQEEIRSLFATWFRRHRRQWPHEAQSRRDIAIGKLRRLLSEVCVEVLEPDLVVLDEFQRFKPLLEAREGHKTEAAALAQRLFRARAEHDEKRVRTLLLSATPYKPYTTDAEIDQEDHYENFLATTRFLLGDDEARVEELRHRLSRFGAALKRAAAGESGQADTVATAKRGVEAALRNVIARTERVAADNDRNAMMEENPRATSLSSADVRQYLAADALFTAVGDRDPMPFWKAAPYLAHFMHGYGFDRRLTAACERSSRKVAEVLDRHGPAFLTAQQIETWQPLDPGNARLRTLVRDLLDDAGLWRLLWVPPTLPYWPLEGPFEGKDCVTKHLLFSAWNVVPDVVSTVLSYEAERRMFGGRIESYHDPARQQRPLLRLVQSADRLRNRLLLLRMPCLRLADEAHPLGGPADRDPRARVRAQVERLLADLPDPQDREVDERWEWAWPVILDPGLREFLPTLRDEPHATSETEASPEQEAAARDVLDRYLNDILTIQAGDLGRRPSDLTDLVTEVALGSPAVLAARTLQMSAGVTEEARRRGAVRIADAFWRLFNQPAVITVVREIGRQAGIPRDESAYWRLVLRYCQQGNLQSVLDEQWHLLWEQRAWSEDVAPNDIAATCVEELTKTIRPTPSWTHARFFRIEGRDAVAQLPPVRMRTRFATRFGHSRAGEDEYDSQDAVRAVFNSPFRPFVLTSTSIGQEGLDFHPWCHRVVHWNLPGNPVDLEQREGRIHRYKGHAVRRNVAAAHGRDAITKWRPGDDIWKLVFDLANDAARDAKKNDLEPYWIAPGEHKVERHVPLLPYAKEERAFERLKQQLAAYRVALGQPRQQELVALLGKAGIEDTQLKDWAVDLSPPDVKPSGDP